MVPHQIISLMDYFGADNTFAMSDHDDHVHVGYAQAYDSAAGAGSAANSAQLAQVLEPEQWERLIGQLSEIDNPRVSAKPSEFATPTRKGGKRASPAHEAE